MTCPRLDESLFLHAHGQLGGALRLRIERHLRRCPACRTKWERWSGEGQRWRRILATEEVPPNGRASHLRSAVADRIRSEPRSGGGRKCGGSDHSHPPTAWVPAILPHSYTRRLTRLLALAVLLALTLAGLAAVGPPLAARVRRAWARVVARASCDQPAPVNRTPPGGTEDPGDGPR